MKLKKLIVELISPKIYNLKNLEIRGLSTDSRKVSAGEIFIALKGCSVDGHKFISESIERGAVCIVVDSEIAFGLSRQFRNTIVIAVRDTKQAFINLAQKFYKNKIKGLKLIAVTGTNGKTTVTYLVESILKACAFKTGIIGTIGYSFPGHRQVSHNTTPGLNDLYKLFYEMRIKGVDFAIMEASSHALEQDRVGGLNFHRAIFTNISRDHLDYHKNFSNYFASKAKLFSMLNKGSSRAVINFDDAYGRKLLKITKADKLTYGLKNAADVKAKDIKLSAIKTEFLIKYKNKTLVIDSKLLGLHNVYNILASVALALSMNLKPRYIEQGIRQLNSVSGRLELVARKGKAKIYIDYAHTPGALKALLNFFNTLKKQQHINRIILVFGCGGERDVIKRPQMGKIASHLADLTILTSDNPRSEDPKGIIEDIKKGMGENYRYFALPDRFEAIKKAINEAKDDDIVLIAGKGHEREQIFKDRIEDFNDSRAIRKVLKDL